MRTSLLRSATFRLTLLAAPLYLLAGWGLLAFVYSSTLAIMDRRVDTGLAAERGRVLEAYAGLDREGIVEETRARIAAERGSARRYLLVEDGRRVVGNFTPGGDGARTTEVALAGGMTLVLGRDLAEEVQFRRVIEETLGLAAVLMVGLAVAAGAVTARLVLRRLHGFNATARRMLRGRLDERMPVSGSGDEFDHLAGNLNEALDRIVELMQATREVTDNIAHDLRSPLSRLRNRLELALLEQGDMTEAVAASIEDTDRVLDTFEALLTIARLDHGLRPELEPTDLAALALDLFDYFQPLAEEHGLDLALEAPAEIEVLADPHLLFQALSNLVDNALRYTPTGGHIRISVQRRGTVAEMAVSDDGPGIPAAKRDEVLRRFVRLDASRHLPGNGLGLAVVDAVTRHHRGTLDLADNRPGLRVTLSLPALPPKSAPT